MTGRKKPKPAPQLVHLTTGETVIPPEVLTPALMGELRRIYAAEGLRFERYVVGGPVGPDGDSLNPVTGLREFFYADTDTGEVGDLGGMDFGDEDEGNETAGGGGRSYPADNDENNTRADELRGIAAEAAYNAEYASHSASETGDDSHGDYAGDGGNEDSRGRTAVTDATDDTARPVGAAPPGQPPGMAPGDLGPGLGRTPAGFTPIGPAGPTREAAGLGRRGGGTSGQSPGTPGTAAPGATPAGAVDIDRPGKLNTIEQSNLAAEIAGGLKASYGRAWSDNLLNDLDKETAKAAGIPDVGPTRENAALLEEAERLQNDLGPGASLGAIGAVNRGLTPGTDAFNEHMEKENAMWAARDRLEVAEAPVREALRRLEEKAEVHKRAIAEVERARRSRSATAEEKRAAQSRARAAAAEVHKAVQEWKQNVGKLSQVREQLREDLNGPAPTYEEVTRPNSEWVNLTSLENILHGFVTTEKYVHPDGREFVFDAETKTLVTDGRRGTFNFAHPREEEIRHFSEDILPHLQGR